jgi:hypothetical protein
MLSSHFDKIARVDRLTPIEDTNQKEFTTHLASVSCHAQPLQDEITQDIPGGFGKDFLMFSDNVDIAEGDRVIIGSDEYRVVGTESFNFNGSSHRETRIRIFKS